MKKLLLIVALCASGVMQGAAQKPSGIAIDNQMKSKVRLIVEFGDKKPKDRQALGYEYLLNSGKNTIENGEVTRVMVLGGEYGEPLEEYTAVTTMMVNSKESANLNKGTAHIQIDKGTRTREHGACYYGKDNQFIKHRYFGIKIVYHDPQKQGQNEPDEKRGHHRKKSKD